MITKTDSPLPYTDAKNQGAADFYFGINATFQFIKQRLGLAGLHRYWQELGSAYFRPVTVRWQAGGLRAVADYWRAFFDAEPGADAEITARPRQVVVRVKRCPAIARLRSGRREITAEYCQHCYFVSEAMGKEAGIAVQIAGGNGRCRQIFTAHGDAKPQDLARIRSCQ